MKTRAGFPDCEEQIGPAKWAQQPADCHQVSEPCRTFGLLWSCALAARVGNEEPAHTPVITDRSNPALNFSQGIDSGSTQVGLRWPSRGARGVGRPCLLAGGVRTVQILRILGIRRQEPQEEHVMRRRLTVAILALLLLAAPASPLLPLLVGAVCLASLALAGTLLLGPLHRRPRLAAAPLPLLVLLALTTLG